MIAIANPLFNHRGSTALFYIGLNPVTLEALLYGVCSAGMLISVFIWFRCYLSLMTNDKFLYLFGRIAPATALIVSMYTKVDPRKRPIKCGA